MHASFLFFDLSSFPQFVVTAFLLSIGFLHLLKTTASRYFAVDAKFNGGGSAHDHLWSPSPKSHMLAASDGGDTCFVCGSSAVKRCSRCKAIRYCSSTCQLKHWKSDHRLKCKEIKSFYYVSVIQPARATHERRKAVGLASIFNTKILYAPARGTFNVLQQPKKVLFPYDEFIKLFNWDSPGFPPCGLLNCGNSCFANVVLQCLTCTKPLVAYLMEKGHSKQCNRNDWCFLCELQLHVHRVSQSLHPFSPLNILSRLPNIGGNLGHGKQEDAHEFMRFAIDTMQSVCLDAFGGEKVLDLSAQETTLIQNIFGGHLQSQVMCTKCGKVSYRYENMMDLTVEIQGVATSLEDCLDQFTAKEWLDGENMYKCDGYACSFMTLGTSKSRCSDYVKAWKRLTVHRAPNILTIALKRFQSGSFGKLNKRVTFPETLDLGLYMSEVEDGTDLYRLYAVVVHVDMLNASVFGHYICYTKDFQGNWYWIDDCKVMKVELDEVLSQGAYMLLYSRISARPFGAKPQQYAGKEKQRLTEVSKEPQQALVEPDEANPVNLAGCLFTDTKLESPVSGCERVLSAEIDPEDIIYGGLGCPSSSSGSAYLEVGKLSHCSRVLEDVSSECCDSNTSSTVNSISKYEKRQDEEFQLPEPSADDPDPSQMGRPSCDSFTSISDSQDTAYLADAPCSEPEMVTWSPISPNAVISSLTVSQATENAKFESSTMYGDESCTGKKPMQLFSCRFLDKHATKKPLCKGVKARMNPIESGHSCIVDRSCNGFVELVDAGCSSTSDSKCDGYSTPISIHQNGGVINGDLSLGMEICETSKGFDQSLEKRFPNENEVPEKETIVDQPCYADCSGCVGLFPDWNDSEGLDQSLEKRFLNENEVPEKESIVDWLCYADCDECAGPPFPDKKGSDASRQDIGPETLQHDPMDLSVSCKKKSLHMEKEAGGNANAVHSIKVETSSIVWVGPVITDKNGGGAFMHDRRSTPLCENGNAAILECGKPLTSSS